MNQEAMKTGKETRTEQPGGEAVASEDFFGAVDDEKRYGCVRDLLHVRYDKTRRCVSRARLKE